MNAFLLRLPVLTAVFTLCGGAGLLFRLSRAGRHGRTMSHIWAAVLLLAVLPLRLPDGWLSVPTLSPPPIAPIAAPAEQSMPAAPISTAVNLPSLPSEPLRARVPTAKSGSAAPLLFSLWCGGALVMFTAVLLRDRRMRTMLRTCSTPCAEAETSAVCAELAVRAGMRQPPELRILDSNLAFPPCTVGLLRPCVYLPASLPAANGSLRAILAHEITHIRRRDCLRKLFALAVCSVHWFNPLAHAILPRVYEDLEPACDRDTLHLLGGEPARVGYMQTLLEVAISMSSSHRGPLILGLGGQKEQIERRFIGMKKTRKNKLYSALALLLICTMTLGASVIFTACVPAKAAQAEPAALTPLTDRIVRYYYDLAPEDEITSEMLEGITSLRLSVASVDTNIESLILAAEAEEADSNDFPLPEDASEDLIAWAQSVIAGNAAAIERYTAERVILSDLFAQKTLVSFHANYADAPEGSYEAAQAILDTFELVPARFFTETICAAVEDEWTLRKYNAFYCLKDANDPIFSDDERQKMLAVFPWSAEHPAYICDPARIARENLHLYHTMYAHGILDPQLLDSAAVDMTQFAVFPNLTTVELIGLTEAK